MKEAEETVKVSEATIARTVVLTFALINQILAVMGKSILPWTDDQVYQASTTLLTVGAALWAWWKNNSFTFAAIKADAYKTLINSTQDGADMKEDTATNDDAEVKQK
jgi:holin, SPP1 family